LLLCVSICSFRSPQPFPLPRSRTFPPAPSVLKLPVRLSLRPSPSHSLHMPSAPAPQNWTHLSSTSSLKPCWTANVSSTLTFVICLWSCETQLLFTPQYLWGFFSASNTKELDVFIKRNQETGFGFRVLGGEGPDQPVSVDMLHSDSSPYCHNRK